MDKCCMFTALLLVYLVYLVAVVDSQYSCMCQKSDGKMDDNKNNPDLRLQLPSDTFSDARGNNHYTCNVISEKPVLTIQCYEREISCPISCLDADAECLHQWSDWTACAMSNGTRIRNRYRDVACASVEPTCCLPSGISLTDTQECILYADILQECLFEWSDWTNCATSDGIGIGYMYRYRNITSAFGDPTCFLPTGILLTEETRCTLYAADLSGWSNCTSPGDGYRHRSLNCSEGSVKENIKEDEKRFKLTEIIFVAFGCFLMGVLLSALLFVLYMKRTQQGCYSKHVKEVQGDSEQLPGPDLQFLAERHVGKKYDPKTPKLEDSKNENKSDDTQYQSLNTYQIDNDRQTYDALEVNESRSDHHGNQPRSCGLKQTGNDKQTDHMTNLQHGTEGVYEYSRDSDHGGHNYVILESELISSKSKAINLGRQDEVGDEQSDAAHEYFVLEHFENGHNQN